MLKKIYRKIKSAEFSLEQTIFFLIAIAGIFMCIVGAITNIPLGLGIITVITPIVNIILSVCCIIYSVKTNKWFIPAIIVVSYALIVLYPVLWFSSGGATGSTMPYLIMSGFIGVILLQGKLRYFFLVAIPLVFSLFIYFEMHYPNITIPYSSRESHYIDLIVGFSISFIVTALLAIIVLSRYHKAKLETDDLVKKLGDISMTDPLTGIYNRRMLSFCLDTEMRKSYEDSMPLTICLIDIDHFKQVNDTYGHLIGDDVLTELAHIIDGFMSENDILGRFGGEEFLIIFKNQTIREALKTVQSFHKTIQAREWETVNRITISCGISEYKKGISYSDFIGDADKRLYKAKETGRNKIVYRKL